MMDAVALHVSSGLGAWTSREFYDECSTLAMYMQSYIGGIQRYQWTDLDERHVEVEFRNNKVGFCALSRSPPHTST